MRKLILYMYTTLDGFIAGPNGEFDDYEPSDEEMAFANEYFASFDGILFGRVIYEGFVEYWDTLDPNDPAVSPREAEFARIFRKMTRAVVSRTLDHVEGDAILIKDDIAGEVTRLKTEPGRDYLLICGPELVGTLLPLGLVDECRLLVKPTIQGRGMALFGEIQGKQALKLLSTRVFASGVVMHHYQITSAPAGSA
jgi:dihydrofolate reductase